jgi:hypothetical protein
VKENFLPLEAHNIVEEITPKKAKAILEAAVGCAWKDCKSKYKGDLPPGWRMIGVYKDDSDIFNGEIDGSLCPAHVEELGKYLWLGYRLSIAAGESNRTNN